MIEKVLQRFPPIADWLPDANRLFAAAGTYLILTSFLLSGHAPLQPPAQTDESDPIPVLAYYYIWYDEQSWNRAKVDFPLLGRYSSDDEYVMRRHIDWAKDAGINGFIVSWKGTEKLNSRLGQLIRLAEQDDFKLAIIYESLDFYRNPLPLEQINDDMDHFINNFSTSPVFDLFGKPMVIWSGSWEFTREQIEGITGPRRDQLLILASEKNVDGYRRVSDLVDGNAYYWSSVDPETHPGYHEKLSSMSDIIHASGGLWIAPAAPGFDSRLLGGETVVERKNGETLRIEMEAAIQSAPDAIGLISWNEFSENSHVEPSRNYDHFYLKTLAELRRRRNIPIMNFDSSVPGFTVRELGAGAILAVSILGLLTVTSLFVIVRRGSPGSRKGM